MNTSPPEEEWWYMNHLRMITMVVMPLLLMAAPALCHTPREKVWCVHAGLAVIGLVPAVRLVLFPDRSTMRKVLAGAFMCLNGWIFVTNAWHLLAGTWNVVIR